MVIADSPGFERKVRNATEIEHTRHRSTTNFIVNFIAGLITYTWQAKKQFLHLSDNDVALCPALI